VKKKGGIALALGGGGVRALSHAGVLRVLTAENIKIYHISGTSMGAVVGAMFALRPDPESLIDKWHEFIKSEIFDTTGLGYFRKRRSDESEEGFFQNIADKVKGRVIINLAQSRRSLVKGRRLRRGLEFLVGNRDFSECEIPLSVVATDLYTGKSIVFNEGSILDAVEASSSIPGFLPPVELNDYLLADGSISMPIPIPQARESGVRPVVAVSADKNLESKSNLSNVLEVLTKSDVITVALYSKLLMKDADVSIITHGENAHWFEFDKVDQFVECGEKAAVLYVDEIKKMIKKQSWWGRILN